MGRRVDRLEVTSASPTMTFESLPKVRAATSLGFARGLPSPVPGAGPKTRRDGELLFEALTGVSPEEIRCDSPDLFLGSRHHTGGRDLHTLKHPREAFSSGEGKGRGNVCRSPVSSPEPLQTGESENWSVLSDGRDGKRGTAASPPPTGGEREAAQTPLAAEKARVNTAESADVIRKGSDVSRKRPSGSPPAARNKRSSGRTRIRAADAGVQTEASETEEESDDGFVFGSYESFFYQDAEIGRKRSKAEKDAE
ncbi:hypothetical protein KFL_007050020 [Klebsormidium nitens]|uniref:Uncharacterized protein n=1 Tax=Klebsormidium nitens TaxID=105231 RepID=A0A1Y1IJA7_KLENI|nr:hypothetical protein KFL_007050020 [Klebsormidium nitens]|eukprot:GAQ90940.1 hypothetical protein KFL_007050020 [Klebsormidium nitens]